MQVVLHTPLYLPPSPLPVPAMPSATFSPYLPVCPFAFKVCWLPFALPTVVALLPAWDYFAQQLAAIPAFACHVAFISSHQHLPPFCLPRFPHPPGFGFVQPHPSLPSQFLRPTATLPTLPLPCLPCLCVPPPYLVAFSFTAGWWCAQLHVALTAIPHFPYLPIPFYTYSHALCVLAFLPSCLPHTMSPRPPTTHTLAIYTVWTPCLPPVSTLRSTKMSIVCSTYVGWWWLIHGLPSCLHHAVLPCSSYTTPLPSSFPFLPCLPCFCLHQGGMPTCACFICLCRTASLACLCPSALGGQVGSCPAPPCLCSAMPVTMLTMLPVTTFLPDCTLCYLPPPSSCLLPAPFFPFPDLIQVYLLCDCTLPPPDPHNYLFPCHTTPSPVGLMFTVVPALPVPFCLHTWTCPAPYYLPTHTYWEEEGPVSHYLSQEDLPALPAR